MEVQRTDQNSAESSAVDSIELLGVRTHNLKNIDVRIPHGSITAITGPSGCGKSSLAFDTIYAEARRQFLDSLSIHARQSLRNLPRPDIRLASGLLPAVCVDQKSSGPNPRATVSTICGIYDYLGLLMSRIGTVRCSRCEQIIDQTSSDAIEQTILSLPERTKVVILAPTNLENSTWKENINEIRKAGFLRARVNGEIVDLDSLPDSDSSQEIEAVVDRIIVKPGISDRISESVAQALKFGGGSLSILSLPPGEEDWSFQRASILYACPDCGESYEEIEPRTFSFYSPFGICLDCEGVGETDQFSFDRVFDDVRGTIKDLPIFRKLPEEICGTRISELNPLLNELGIDDDSRLDSLEEDLLKALFAGSSTSLGLQTVLEKTFVTSTNAQILEDLKTFRGHEPCSSCQGSRLCVAANHVFLGQRNIGQIVSDSVVDSIEFFAQLDSWLDEEQRAIAAPIRQEILNRLNFLNEIGIGYLTLNRSAATLSGGEFQRVRLATGLGNRQTDVCYILDEPTTGLHPADNHRLLKTVQEIQGLGNTVILVEHDPDAMRIADHIIDLGPGAGENGGMVLACGEVDALQECQQSITGNYLSGKKLIGQRNPRPLPPESEWTAIVKPKLNNLKGDTFRFPPASLTCVTGVSGSGKSSMVSGVLVPVLRNNVESTEPPSYCESIENGGLYDKIIVVDQQPIGRSPRSNAATFTGIFDEIRKVYASTKLAKQLGFKNSHFSFNSRLGACPDCNGQGQIKIEMLFMPDVYTICETCNGKRFSSTTLSIRFKGKTIAELLELSVTEAGKMLDGFEKISRVLKCMEKVGLGYLRLGQPANSLSGGEAQRLKIATHLANPSPTNTLFVLDEPTSGLHFADIERLQGALNELVDNGQTVLLIEHHVDMIRNADYVIDFGPGGGIQGGHIVATGTPESISRNSQSITGPFLDTTLG